MKNKILTFSLFFLTIKPSRCMKGGNFGDGFSTFFGLEIPIKNQDIIHFVLEKITWSNSNLKMKSLHIA